MSDAYTKLFGSITESTIWGEPAGTRLVWITFLAKCNKHGEVFGSIPGIARLANVSLEECETALNTLLAPDKWSRTPDNQGRRIVAIDGGWQILNHAKFDVIRNASERAEYKRRWDQENRGSRPNSGHRTPDKVTTTPDTPPTVPTPPALTPIKEKKEQKKKQPQAAFVLPDWIRPEVWEGFAEMRKRKRAPLTTRACAMVVTELIKLRDAGNEPNTVLDQSTRNSWTDVYEIKPTYGGNGKPVIGKTMQAMQTLQAMKDVNKQSDFGSNPKIDMPRFGRSAGG